MPISYPFTLSPSMYVDPTLTTDETSERNPSKRLV